MILLPTRARSQAAPDSGARRQARGALAALALSAMIFGGMTVAEPGHEAAAQTPPESFADLAEQVSPAVVNISTTRAVEAQGGPGGPGMPFDFPPGSPFEEFFRQFQDRFGGGGGDGGHAMRETHALGSGFIIDPAGYVVTNNHVIEDADEVVVTLVDGRQLPAEVVGTDPQTDLALLKVKDDDDLPAVEFGDSDAIRVGDWVIAVGNPFGLGGTVSAGIVSARSRDIHAGPFDDFLQLDAAINPGNSGGPTFAMNGKVIGVNTAIVSPTGSSVGIGFAIPSNLVKSIVDQLREDGSVERGWLGVQIQQVTPDLATALGLDEPKGALVSRVMPDGPAAAAGLRQGDVIVGFDGKDVPEMRDLPRIVAQTPAGSTVDIEVWRDGDTKTLSAEIAQQEPPETVASNAQEPDQPQQPSGAGTEVPAIGAVVADLSPALRDRFELPEETSGVVIVDLQPDGPAAENGLRPGDVIEEVSQEQVDSPDDVTRLAGEAEAKQQSSLLLLVNRQGNALFVALALRAA